MPKTYFISKNEILPKNKTQKNMYNNIETKRSRFYRYNCSHNFELPPKYLLHSNAPAPPSQITDV